MKKIIWIIVGLFLILVSGCGKSSQSYFEEARGLEEETFDLEADSEVEAIEADEECHVYICGAVKSPGVYTLPKGSRIYEVILMAGGLLEEASEDSINQAQELADGQMIKVPTKEEEKEQLSTEKTDGRVNLNTADIGELMTIPGIGEAKARSILSYREEAGGFSSVEEIMNITGIKEGVYSKIKDYITVN